MDSSSSSSYATYDVLMNYSFGDIGGGFITHLHGALKRSGFTVADRTELLKGIKESEMYAVIFSPNYASSARSLDELVDIMNCRGKRIVYPVFYKVEPSDVRNQRGTFMEDFQAHEVDDAIDPDRVQKWRQALRDVCDLAGSTLENNGDECKFIDEIVKYFMKIKKPEKLCDISHCVGIESRIDHIISKLRLSDQAFPLVAILGVSGSGKTTIAKAVYDRIAGDFDVRCFIENISSYEERGGRWKDELQRDCISCLSGGNNELRGSHNVGAAKIKRLLKGRKALLVLDDVYTFEHLEVIGINSASFGKGSRVIVTTRNKDSLGKLQHTPYEVSLLEPEESSELFTRLIGGDPLDKKFVDEIVKCSGGIPLVLEVWSRSFPNPDRSSWSNKLEYLKIIPHEDTQKKLRRSYDSLPPRSQNLFLDIACLFDGMKKDLVIKVLQEEDFDTDLEIQKLLHKFLVNTSNGYLRLHSVIREMGKEVVWQENEEDPGQRTRLVGYRDVVRVLTDCSGTDSVRSVKLGRRRRPDVMEMGGSDVMEEPVVQLEAFKRMINLRYIQLLDYRLQWSSSNDGMCSLSFKKLKYLEWEWFPCKSIDHFDMGNVMVIKLHESKLEKLVALMSFKKLRILKVTYSKSLTKTGDFTLLKNLEVLSFSGCSNLQELDSSVGFLQKLVKLDLSGCKKLKRLPWKTIGNLTSLQRLYLGRCYSISKISHEVGSLKSLVYLDLSENKCNSLPDSLCQLHQLTIIELSGCTNLKSIPNLPPSIKSIIASDCTSLVYIPDTLTQLHQLTLIKLSGCTNLKSIPNLPPSIKSITASGYEEESFW